MLWKILNLVAAILYLLAGGYIIFRFKDKLPYKVTTILMTLLIFIPYVFSLINYYCNYDGVTGWHFKYTLPTANISPFMFFMVFVVLFLPKIIQKHFYLLMALFSFVMVVAGIGSPVYYAFFYHYYYSFISIEWITHLTMAFFGIYLLLTKKIEVTVKNCVKASMIIYVTVAIMMILNIILGTAFFGLAFNGKHNIYTLIVISNPYLSALVYVIGLTCFLIIGYWFLKFIKRIDEKRTVVMDEKQTT
ncbi:MAG: hypothetical protein ACOX0I_02525 [Bacilli bacterium]|jgi:hypothetical protein